MFEFITDETQRTQAQAALDAKMAEAKTTFDSQIAEFNSGVDTKIATAIAEATKGLKVKNEELIGEKRKIQEALEKYSNIDPARAAEALKFIDENEFAKLLKEGKIDEVLERNAAKVRADADKAYGELKNTYDLSVSENANKVTDLETRLSMAEAKATSLEQKYALRLLNEEITREALLTQIRPEAISDVLLKSAGVFTLGSDEKPVALDDKKQLRKNPDGSIMTVTSWIKDLQKTSPHYWPDSVSAEALGSDNNKAASDLDRQLIEAANKNDMEAYRKIREKQKGKK